MANYKITNIEYDIGFEDVADMIFEYLEDCTHEEIEQAAADQIAYVKRGLPKEMVLEADNLENICDIISDKTGFLVNSCECEKISD